MVRKGKESNIRYVKLDDDMTESAAWTALSDKAIWCYIELRKRYNYKRGGNNFLVLPYSKVSWRMNKATYRKKLKELLSFGFIKVVEKGGLMRRTNIFALSDEWKRISREIVDKKGREAIRSGLSKKPSSKNNIKNLKGKRIWER